MRFLISAAIVKNAFSTLLADLAEVSKKGMPRSSANACNTSLCQNAERNTIRGHLHVQSMSSHLCLLKVHLSLAIQITLVADQELVHVLACIPVDFVQPLLHVVKAFPVRDIVHLQRCMLP